MSSYSGSCACKAVTFTVTGEPIKVVKCYCNLCRKAGGNTHQFVAIVNRDQLKIDNMDNLTLYKSIGGSGNTKIKSFCKTCGTPIAGLPEHVPIRTFYPALLDSGNDKFLPQENVFEDSALDCYKP